MGVEADIVVSPYQPRGILDTTRSSAGKSLRNETVNSVTHNKRPMPHGNTVNHRLKRFRLFLAIRRVTEFPQALNHIRH